LKIKNQTTKNLDTKTQPDSVFRLSVTNIEEQGILESFARLPQAEREIVRQLLDEFGSQRVAAIRFPLPFGPKSINERRRSLSPIYKLIRYHRLIFDSVAAGVFRSTYLPWIDSITHIKAGEEEIELRLNSNLGLIPYVNDVSFALIGEHRRGGRASIFSVLSYGRAVEHV
jgi:hypothetical protein